MLIGLAALGSATAVALGSATPALAANQALMLNGIGIGDLPDLVMSNVLGGMFGNSKNYQRTAVTWPMQARPVTGLNSMRLGESVTVGADNLGVAITKALTEIGPNERVTVVGLSAGALVADEQMRRLLTSPDAPDKSKLTFVVVADSSRILFNKNRYDGILGYQYTTPVDTKYDTIVVTAEYDGFADFPDRPWNFLAVANAIAGEIVTHVPSMFTDLSTVPAQNITVTTNKLGGVTTQYFIPAAQLPLVKLLPFLAPQEESLRKIIDSGYARNDGKAAATVAAPVAAAAAVDPVVTLPVADSAGQTAPVAPVQIAPAAVDVPAEPVARQREAAPIELPAPVAEAPGNRVVADNADESPRPTSRRAPAAHGSDRSGEGRSAAAGSAAATRAR